MKYCVFIILLSLLAGCGLWQRQPEYQRNGITFYDTDKNLLNSRNLTVMGNLNPEATDYFVILATRGINTDYYQVQYITLREILKEKNNFTVIHANSEWEVADVPHTSVLTAKRLLGENTFRILVVDAAGQILEDASYALGKQRLSQQLQ